MESILLEQQVFSSGPRGFSTLSSSPGLSPDELQELEDRSVYRLPQSLLYEERALRPVKFIYYRLQSGRFVIGRAIYYGNDYAGRAGNFLFHNIVIDEDGLSKFSFNPVRAIRALLSKDYFFDRLPGVKDIGVIRIPLESVSQSTNMRLLRDVEATAQLIEACLGRRRAAIRIIGITEEILDFLEWLMSFLPHEAIKSIAFDTYAYDIRHHYDIAGLPEMSIESPESCSILVDLASGACSFYEKREPSDLALLSAEMACQVRLEEALAFFALINALSGTKGKDIHNLEKQLFMLPERPQRILVKERRQNIIDLLSKGVAWRIFPLLIDEIEPEDAEMNILMGTPGFPEYLIALANSKADVALAKWLIAAGPDSSKPELALARPDLLETTLCFWAKQHPLRISFIVDILNALKSSYRSDCEAVVYRYIFPSLGNISNNHAMAALIIDALLSLPFDSIPLEHRYLQILRNVAACKLSPEENFCLKLLGVDISAIPPLYRVDVVSAMISAVFYGSTEGDVKTPLEGIMRSCSDLVLFTRGVINASVPKRWERYRETCIDHLFKKLPESIQAELQYERQSVQAVKRMANTTNVPGLKNNFLSRTRIFKRRYGN
jgi:hypothetical protein